MQPSPARYRRTRFAQAASGFSYSRAFFKDLVEQALSHAKSEIDLARAQSELAIMAAQIAALRKFREKR